uniref:Uncharacterized protein n=1 Tax=Thermomicrobium roseum TaxID=500 RepID=A0A7C5RS40_THERO
MDQYTTTRVGHVVTFCTAAVGVGSGSGSGSGRGSSSPSGSGRPGSSSAGWGTTVAYLSNVMRREPEGNNGTAHSTRTRS